MHTCIHTYIHTHIGWQMNFIPINKDMDYPNLISKSIAFFDELTNRSVIGDSLTEKKRKWFNFVSWYFEPSQPRRLTSRLKMISLLNYLTILMNSRPFNHSTNETKETARKVYHNDFHLSVIECCRRVLFQNRQKRIRKKKIIKKKNKRSIQW